jgi:hypothetical protein
METFLLVLAALLSVTNPPVTALVFLSITKHASVATRQSGTAGRCGGSAGSRALRVPPIKCRRTGAFLFRAGQANGARAAGIGGRMPSNAGPAPKPTAPARGVPVEREGRFFIQARLGALGVLASWGQRRTLRMFSLAEAAPMLQGGGHAQIRG